MQEPIELLRIPYFFESPVLEIPPESKLSNDDRLQSISNAFDKEQLNVLHVIEPFAGGIATFIKQLTELNPSDNHCILHGSRSEIIDSSELRKRFPRNASFIKWRYAQREIKVVSDLMAFFYLLKVLRSEQFDVVHLHSSKAGFLGRIACKLMGIERVIYSPHSGAFLRTDISVFKQKLFRNLEVFANRFSGVVICTSDSEHKAFTEAGILSKYINNGAYYSKELDKKITKPIFRVLSCGNICEQKNPSEFNELAQRLEHDPRFEFVWVGDGEQRHLLTSSNIKITGWIPRERVLKHLRQADLYISSSSWEGMPYAVLEAMSQECPLLLSPCVGNIDLIPEGKNGHFFDSTDEAYDRILEFFVLKDKGSRMGRESRRLIKDKFNAETCISMYYANYEKLLVLPK